MWKLLNTSNHQGDTNTKDNYVTNATQMWRKERFLGFCKVCFWACVQPKDRDGCLRGLCTGSLPSPNHRSYDTDPNLASTNKWAVNKAVDRHMWQLLWTHLWSCAHSNMIKPCTLSLVCTNHWERCGRISEEANGYQNEADGRNDLLHSKYCKVWHTN